MLEWLLPHDGHGHKEAQQQHPKMEGHRAQHPKMEGHRTQHRQEHPKADRPSGRVELLPWPNLRRQAADTLTPGCPSPAFDRVAILLRGQAFRDGRMKSAGGLLSAPTVAAQQLAWRSWLTQIVEPLEACGSRVDVFAVECSGGAAGRAVREGLGMFGYRLARALTRCPAPSSQGESVNVMLDFFEAHAVPSEYSLVIVGRHDLVWTTPIDAWNEANLSRFNMLGQCERLCYNESATRPDILKYQREWSDSYSRDSAICNTHGGPPPICMQDFVQTMPGSQYRAFAGVVHSDNGDCFTRFPWGNASVQPASWNGGKGKHQYGHRCYGALARALPEPPSLLVRSWRPVRVVREPGPLCHVLTVNDTGKV